MMKEFDKSNIDYKKIILILIGFIAIVALIIFGSIQLFSGKKDGTNKNISSTNTKGTALNITSENVTKLYTYVSSCNSGNRYTKSDYFFTNKKVLASKMHAEDKLKCAFQFIKQDNLQANNGDYYIVSSVINNAYKTFFGTKTTLDTSELINSNLNLFLDRTNTDSDYATLNYDANFDVYRLKFNGDKYSSPVIRKYYSALISASSYDGGIILKEKIIYVKDVSKGNTYSYEVYSDYKYTNKIGTKKNLTQDKISIQLSDYYEKASTITYIFKQDKNNNYYFYSSEIDTK